MAGVAERLAEVRARIAAAGGDAGAITLVAVSKGARPASVAAAREAGLTDFGENYAHELVAKAATAGAGARWHFLGAVQRRKVRDIAPLVHLWQSVDRLAEGEEIARHAPGAGVLVQVEVTGDAGRNGCRWDEVPGLVDDLRALALDVRGLMCIGPRHDPRPAFRRLSVTARALELSEVSMGMSGDLEAAVQEGATMVRVGNALFGPRPAPARLRR
ncbi:MAG TPA: YggS family pyridoxal phosphate-dependent enzyme [Acidimicrobiales bacterium]|nr:YggS family pyridoxal phosphate-dependent enzyme [Acidimicrobiales bacterium]